MLKDTLSAPFGEMMAIIHEEMERERQANEQQSPRKDVRSLLLSRVNADEQMQRLDRLIRGQKGKRVALVVTCAMELGWFAEKPSFAALEEAFGELGNKDGFNKQMRAKDFFTTEEKKPFFDALIG